MPIITKYLFVASMDVDPEKEDLFNEVYDTEHVPNLLKVPGVHRSIRAGVSEKRQGGATARCWPLSGCSTAGKPSRASRCGSLISWSADSEGKAATPSRCSRWVTSCGLNWAVHAPR